ncbi:3'-phosphoadenosine 5'-phosphosulfate sulfurtransferase DndC [Candidatus Nitrotoga sp. HW29]|uniref:DNA phosphorothioation system sulfurtransferase DndC n=1 Tax=Candidatus Nitrotoga sp. HW29 TaxID=2886963 RepID=UPI000E3B3CF3|nr:DNA phosphorothioation system sulfurtransferase DndC [Candidatus Nitrotoga sp. HW29]RFC31750.1 MAG: DNA sulfur modification protein DndC [Candidatus Nitrotoga sp. SPKER]CAH1905035.1 3'-phosphoadenosine 5'-phosphosulfate sulfurtransferase DndC [Candidatus Nitrotoga sp. HW29]
MSKENITMEDRIETAIRNTQDLYLSDTLPWVVGYSGGKDSTATLQLIWKAIAALPVDKRSKPIHVISTDTLVENPVVAIWVTNSLIAMQKAATEQEMPIIPHRLTPKLEDRFWVNLIGRGYPAPRPLFRWCTSRLKINASNTFITELANNQGEAILVLGSRKAESQARDKVLARYENSTRELLSRNADANLDRVWVYTPVSTWTSDDVWEYLIENENPWNYDNIELFHIYRGATPDAECPLVVDKSTPSCGDSRFGCFVCTMVSEDKSMQAMIQNDEDRRWMMPLLSFRNEYLKTEGDRGLREFTKMGGSLQLQFLGVKSGGRTAPSRPGKVVSEKVVRRLTSTSDGEEGYPMPNRKVLVLETRVVEGDGETRETTYKIEKIATLVHGPYTQNYREAMLEALLRAQETIRNNLPESISEFSIITPEELEEIRRIWVIQKREFEDSVPDIFLRATGKAYPIPELDETTPFRPEDIRLLRDVCMDMAIDSPQSGPLDSKQLLFTVLRNQLGIQHSYRGAIRRVGLHGELEDMLETRSFDNEDEALDFALQRKAGGNELMYEMRDASDVFAYIPEEQPAQELEV